MADTSVKLSGTYDSIEAYNILEQMRDLSDDFEDWKDDAEAAATNAQTYAGNANTSALNAAASEGNASTYAGNASASATLAENYSTTAGTAATNAGNSATAAYNSEVAAAASAASAAQFGVVGAVMAFAGSTSPAGWLLCDGSAVSRTTYADLYAVIGDTYGSGDGSTTFNLPDLADKFIQGNATSGTVKAAGLPNITGTFSVRPFGTSSGSAIVGRSGAFTQESVSSTDQAITTGSTGNHSNRVTLDASSSSAIYGNSTTVQPPALTMRYIIKY
jgi:microcystin-dependent protein